MSRTFFSQHFDAFQSISDTIDLGIQRSMAIHTSMKDLRVSIFSTTEESSVYSGMRVPRASK